jgi:hypothetical protein
MIFSIPHVARRGYFDLTWLGILKEGGDLLPKLINSKGLCLKGLFSISLERPLEWSKIIFGERSGFWTTALHV